ncbi:hypothetical protein CPC16_004215 [Podila verticillata]|nr:hypothetical protein CPC16_004215 [Podila verticillata]
MEFDARLHVDIRLAECPDTVRGHLHLGDLDTGTGIWSQRHSHRIHLCAFYLIFSQIIENFKLGSAGDVSNLIGCILTHQLPFQMYLAIYFCIADVILFGQWIYYSQKERRRNSLPDIVVGLLPETTESDHHLLRSGAIIGPTTFVDDQDQTTANGLEHSETVSPLLQRPRPRRATTASDIAHRRSTSIVLFGLMLLAMKQTLPGLQEDTTGKYLDRRFGASQHSRTGRIFARGLEEDGEPVPPDQTIVQLGRIFAWVCTVFYLSSRMPQLWKNYRRKSVQGLSILMFFWAAMGNLTYTLSILNSANAVNPETSRQFLREAVPYVLGSSGTLMFDVSIFGQWLYYTGRLNFLRRRSRHRHHHHRVRGSHSHSRMDSMAMSPSGSQSGLYNILVDEEDPNELEQHLHASEQFLQQGPEQIQSQHVGSDN